MNFSIWDNSVHEHPDQKKRFESALTGKLIPISVDFENRTGTFNGSGKEPYYTTLETCTCSDFKRRKLPCKHMYRLAIELKLININNKSIVSGSYGNDERTLKANAKKIIDTLNEDEAITLADYCYHLHYNDTCLFNRLELPEVIKISGLFEELDDNAQKLSKLKKAELIEIAATNGQNLKKLKKTDLVTLVMGYPTPTSEQYLNSMVVLSAKEEYKPILLSLHKYAHKLYPQGHLNSWEDD